MVNVPPNVGASKASASPAARSLQALGFKSPGEVIDLLSLLKIDGEPVLSGEQGALSPQEKAKAVITYFERAGISAKEFPQLAAAIKRGLKQGTFKFDSDNRISLSKEQIKRILGNIRHSNTPPEFRSARRRLPRKAPTTATRTGNPQTIARKDLKLHPETPSADALPAGLEQRGSTLAILYALLPESAKKLVIAAREEQKVLSGVTANA